MPHIIVTGDIFPLDQVTTTTTTTTLTQTYMSSVPVVAAVHNIQKRGFSSMSTSELTGTSSTNTGSGQSGSNKIPLIIAFTVPVGVAAIGLAVLVYWYLHVYQSQGVRKRAMTSDDDTMNLQTKEKYTASCDPREDPFRLETADSVEATPKQSFEEEAGGEELASKNGLYETYQKLRPLAPIQPTWIATPTSAVRAFFSSRKSRVAERQEAGTQAGAEAGTQTDSLLERPEPTLPLKPLRLVRRLEGHISSTFEDSPGKENIRPCTPPQIVCCQSVTKVPVLDKPVAKPFAKQTTRPIAAREGTVVTASYAARLPDEMSVAVGERCCRCEPSREDGWLQCEKVDSYGVTETGLVPGVCFARMDTTL